MKDLHKIIIKASLVLALITFFVGLITLSIKYPPKTPPHYEYSPYSPYPIYQESEHPMYGDFSQVAYCECGNDPTCKKDDRELYV